MSSAISTRLNRYKLHASFSGKSVCHIAVTSDLDARQRRIDVQTVWNTEDRLGSGAFGVVWRQRADSGQLRAVKVISRAHLNIQEVEALVDLQDHPDLFIRFFGWFEDLDRDSIHIAMEYIEHGHLGGYIAEYQTAVETKEITSQILEGLVIMHEREICHRDLKPENILIASLSPIWVKITDFGISKRWVGTSLKTHCGTAIYRSPEQLGILPRQFRAARNSYTNLIDMWALGAIVHEMLTLEIPFLDTYIDDDLEFTSTTEVTVDTDLLYGYCHGVNPFPCDSLHSNGVSEEGIEFVKSLMVVNPSERLSAAAALSSAWLIQNSSIASPFSTTGHPAAPPAPAVIPLPGSVDYLMNELTKPARASHRIRSHSAPRDVSGTGPRHRLRRAPMIYGEVTRGRSLTRTQQSEQNSSSLLQEWLS